MTAAVIQLRPLLDDFADALPKLTKAEVEQRKREKQFGNEHFAIADLWSESTEVKAAFSRAGVRGGDVELLAMEQWRRIASAARDAPTEPPLPITVDATLGRQIDATERSVASASRQVADQRAALAEAADRVQRLSLQGQHPTTIASARSELERRTSALAASEAVLAAATRSLEELREQARDPSRQIELGELQRLIESYSYEAVMASHAEDFALLRKIGTQLERVRKRLEEAIAAAQAARGEAVDLSATLGLPPPPDLALDWWAARREMRKAICKGVVDAGGRPYSFERITDCWNA